MPTTNSLYLDITQDKTAGLANVVYNGFRFPLGRHSSVSFSPEMSDDGRTVKYLRADIRIEFVWVDRDGSENVTTPQFNYLGRNTDLTFPALRQALSNPGQPLRFVAEGVGDFRIQENGYYDVNNGPKPKVVSAVPIAGGLAQDVVWECSTWCPNCTDNIGLYGIAQLPFTVSWGMGVNGITTRSINGSIEIPLSRTPNPGQRRALTTTRETADYTRDIIGKLFPRLTGFERSQNYTLSSDRKTLNFSITDTEIATPNPYFPGIVKMSIPRRYTSDYKTGFTQWQGTVSGSIEVAPGYSKVRAWTAFATVFKNIFDKRTLGKLPKTSTTDQPYPGVTADQKDSWAMITAMSFEEEIYGRTLSFSINYRLFCSLRDLFKATGLFQPLNISASEASWNLWKTSTDKIQGPRGWRGVRFEAEDDIIVDLCDPSLRFPNTDYQIPVEESKLKDGDKPVGPSAENSYLLFENELTAVAEDGTLHAIPLSKTAAVQESTSIDKGSQAQALNFASQEVGTPTAVPIVHRVRPTLYRFIMTGRSIRVGFQPVIPNLRSIGGVKAYKRGRDLTKTKVAGTGTDVATGQPMTIYAASWRKEYVLEKRPDNGSIDWDGHIGQFQ